MTKVYDNATDIITFARSSSGTALRRVGYGDELVTNGDFATGDLAGWSVIGSDATHSVTYSSGGARYQSDTTSPVLFFSNGSILEIGKLYQITVETTAYTSGSLKTDSFSGSKVLSTGLGTVTINAVASSDSFVIVRNSTNVDITIDNISVREVIFDRATDDLVLFEHPDDIPRIEYAADGSLKGLLIEEQRTNLVTYSEDFENAAWEKAETVAIDSTLVTGPDGTLSGRRVLNFDDAVGDRLIEAVSITNATLTASMWVKGEGDNIGKDIRLAVKKAGGTFVVTSVSHTLTADWERIHATFTQLPDNTGAQIILNCPTVNQASEVLIYGAQLEEGSFATSYIPTSGSQQTRSADIASIPVSAFGYNQDAGTVVVDFATLATFGSRTNDGVLSLRDNSTDKYDLVRLYLAVSDNLNVQVRSNNSNVFATGIQTDLPEQSETKVATGFTSGSYAASVDGGVAQSLSTNTAYPVAGEITELAIGEINGSDYLNGHIKSLQYYPRRLTDAQLQELTA